MVIDDDGRNQDETLKGDGAVSYDCLFLSRATERSSASLAITLAFEITIGWSGGAKTTA